MDASVYFNPTSASAKHTTLDVGRHRKIAEIDVPVLQSLDQVPSELRAKRELAEIMRNSQFKNMVESGSIRMETGVSISDVVKEVKRAVFDADGVDAGFRDKALVP